MDSLEGCLDQAHALRLQVFRELDDQNGVLGGKSDGGQQSDLEINVVRQTAQMCGQQSPEYTEWHNQDDGERNGPAFVERSQAQKNDEERDGVKRRCLRTGKRVFIGWAGPFPADDGGRYCD